jgi:hypothetical protein
MPGSPPKAPLRLSSRIPLAFEGTCRPFAAHLPSPAIRIRGFRCAFPYILAPKYAPPHPQMNYSLQFMGNPAFPLRELPESTGGELGEDGLTFATKEKVSPYGLCNSSKWLPASRSHFCVCYRQATINGSPERNRFRKPGPLRPSRCKGSPGSEGAASDASLASGSSPYYGGSMRRTTVTIPDELEAALEAYRREAEIPPGISAVMQLALRYFLADRGYLEGKDREEGKERPWPRYPLYSGDPTLAERDEEALAGGSDTPAFGEH